MVPLSFLQKPLVATVNKKTNEADFGLLDLWDTASSLRLKAVFTFMLKLGNTWRKSSGRGLQRVQLGFYELCHDLKRLTTVRWLAWQQACRCARCCEDR